MKHSPVPFLLLVVLGVNAEGLQHDLDCNDQARAVCLSKGYSTFDFPLRTKPNLIKIGIIDTGSLSSRAVSCFLVLFCYFRF